MVNSVFDGRSANLAAAQKKDYTILTVNHNIQRAACVMGITPFFLLGALGGQIIAGEAWRYLWQNEAFSIGGNRYDLYSGR